MRITQGTFSFLPDLSDDEIQAQIAFCIQNDWAVSIEHTDDPHPRNVYWEMWGLPFFDLESPDAVLEAINACRNEMGASYIRVNGYDRSYGRQTTALSFIVNRPPREKSFRLERTEGTDRRIHYTLRTLTDGPAVMRHEEVNGGRSPGAGSA